MTGLLAHPEAMKRRMLGEDTSGGLLGPTPANPGLLKDRTGAFAGLPQSWSRDRQSNNVVDMRNASALQRLFAEMRSLPLILGNGASNIAARMQPPIMSEAEMQSRMRQIGALLPDGELPRFGAASLPSYADVGR